MARHCCSTLPDATVNTHQAAAVDVQHAKEVPYLPLLQVCEPAEQLQEQWRRQALGATAGRQQRQCRDLAECRGLGVPVLRSSSDQTAQRHAGSQSVPEESLCTVLYPVTHRRGGVPFQCTASLHCWLPVCTGLEMQVLPCAHTEQRLSTVCRQVLPKQQLRTTHTCCCTRCCSWTRPVSPAAAGCPSAASTAAPGTSWSLLAGCDWAWHAQQTDARSQRLTAVAACSSKTPQPAHSCGFGV